MSAKVLLLDIENTPLRGLSWEVYDTTLFHVEQPSYMLSFAVKWLGEKKGQCHALYDYPSFKKNKTDDTPLLKSLHPYLDEADVVVAHNGDNFDIKKINTRYLINGLHQPSPYKTIDTLKICRRHFKFESNKLDNVAAHLGVGRKLPTQGKDTWLGCMAGDSGAWATIKKYNLHDVDPLLEGVYLKLRPWFAQHPNLSVYGQNPGCPVCESDSVQRRGWNVAKTRKTPRFQCHDCGHWFSGKAA